MKEYVLNGTRFTLGCNAQENWALLSTPDKDHVWVHLEDCPSAHCIIHVDEVLPEELAFARELILAQTKKASRSANIIHAPIRCLKRGSKPGEVIVSNRSITST
jgi:hypothetical protein